MKNIIVILSVLIGIFTVANASGTSLLSTRIVNGTVVTNRTAFAYQVSFRLKAINFHFCGGTIISERVILTAAHCFQTYTASLVSAVVGDLDTSVTSSETISMDLDMVVTHADYDASTIENDVAVAMTKENFTWSSTVYFLPLANITPVVGAECYVSGWGTTTYGGTTSSVLLYAVVPVLSENVCTSAYGSLILDGMVCAGYLDGSADACSGDSGGPLACGGVIAGIVSWGYQCAVPQYPGVYTDVSYFKSWIEAQIESYEPNSSHNAYSIYSQIFITLFLILCAMLAK